MDTRFFKFLIVLCGLFIAQRGLGQNTPLDSGSKDSLPLIHSILNKRFVLMGDLSSPVAADYYAKNLTFFCRQELKFEKAVKIPLRLRVGSLEQCNKLEGK